MIMRRGLRISEAGSGAPPEAKGYIWLLNYISTSIRFITLFMVSRYIIIEVGGVMGVTLISEGI